MNKAVLHYDKEHDILYVVIREGEEHHFVEIADGIMVEFDEDDQPIGIEILNASKVLLSILEREQLVAISA